MEERSPRWGRNPRLAGTRDERSPRWGGNLWTSDAHHPLVSRSSPHCATGLAESIKNYCPEEEDALEQCSQMQSSGAARALATAAQLRLHAQIEHHRNFLQAQRRDERAMFIYGLVSAYQSPATAIAAAGGGSHD